MRMERLAVTMPHSTTKLLRQYAQLHDVDQCVIAKKAVTDFCRITPSQQELLDHGGGQERIFISLPDTAMRLLEFWSASTGIAKTKLMEWAIRKLAEEQIKESEEEIDT